MANTLPHCSNTYTEVQLRTYKAFLCIHNVCTHTRGGVAYTQSKLPRMFTSVLHVCKSVRCVYTSVCCVYTSHKANCLACSQASCMCANQCVAYTHRFVVYTHMFVVYTHQPSPTTHCRKRASNGASSAQRILCTSASLCEDVEQRFHAS